MTSYTHNFSTIYAPPQNFKNDRHGRVILILHYVPQAHEMFVARVDAWLFLQSPIFHSCLREKHRSKERILEGRRREMLKAKQAAAAGGGRAEERDPKVHEGRGGVLVRY